MHPTDPNTEESIRNFQVWSGMPWGFPWPGTPHHRWMVNLSDDDWGPMAKLPCLPKLGLKIPGGMPGELQTHFPGVFR